MAKTLFSQCRGSGFDPWSGNRIPHATATSSHGANKINVLQLRPEAAKLKKKKKKRQIIFKIHGGLPGGGAVGPGPLLTQPLGGSHKVHGVARSGPPLSDFAFTFHFHALEKEMATHFSVLA